MFSVAYLKLITFLHLLYKNTISLLFSAASPNCGCRFYPPCSDYFLQASKFHGPLVGLKMGINRLLRCNGLNLGGYDPIVMDPVITNSAPTSLTTSNTNSEKESNIRTNSI